MQGPAEQKTWVQRHLAGWPVGLALVVAAALSALLVVPRAVPPRELPLPVVDRDEERRFEASEAALAGEALASPLPYEVRAVGEALRRFGSVAQAQPEPARALKKQLRELVSIAQKTQGDRALLRLRALQTRLFVQAALQASSAPSEPELLELGGEFNARAKSNGWYDAHGFVGTPEELATLFRVRWGDLTGLRQVQPFAPTLNEWRAYYRFLMANPPPASADGGQRSGSERLAQLDALSRLDPDYPSDLARGVVLYGQGAYAEAASAFAAHLAQHPDGPWTLRAKNHLAACGAMLSD